MLIKRKYTMSPAAVKQRKQAPKKEHTEGPMTVTRVSCINNEWARMEYGSVNHALTNFRTASAARK